MLTTVSLCMFTFVIHVSLCWPMFTHLYICLPLFTHVNPFLLVFTYVYPYLLVFTYDYSDLPMFTPFYACLPMFTLVYLCLPMITHVCLCLLVFTYVYNCLLMLFYISLPMFTRVYICLPLFTRVTLSLHTASLGIMGTDSILGVCLDMANLLPTTAGEGTLAVSSIQEQPGLHSLPAFVFPWESDSIGAWQSLCRPVLEECICCLCKWIWPPTEVAAALIGESGSKYVHFQ